jgi:hypothetical protein
VQASCLSHPRYNKLQPRASGLLGPGSTCKRHSSSRASHGAFPWGEIPGGRAPRAARCCPAPQFRRFLYNRWSALLLAAVAACACCCLHVPCPWRGHMQHDLALLGSTYRRHSSSRATMPSAPPCEARGERRRAPRPRRQPDDPNQASAPAPAQPPPGQIDIILPAHALSGAPPGAGSNSTAPPSRAPRAISSNSLLQKATEN